MSTTTVKNYFTEEQKENLSEGTLKAIALKEFLGEDYYVHAPTGKVYKDEDFTDELTEIGDDEYNDYLVLTDAEATEKATQYIKDSLWAFNADFIIDHSKLPYDAIEMIKTYQEEKCEGANDTIEALIDDMDEFVEDAISADGRGHFMSSYDGEENEQEVELWGKGDNANPTFYIYRIN